MLTLLLVLAAGAAVAQSDNVINAEGMGPVKLGQKYGQLPKSLTGVYTSLQEFDDHSGAELMLGGNKVATLFGRGKVAGASLEAAGTSLATSDGVFIGLPASDFFDMSGWTLSKDSGNVGDMYAKDGVTVVISRRLTPSGMAWSREGKTLRARDFAPEAVVERIFIGNVDSE